MFRLFWLRLCVSSATIPQTSDVDDDAVVEVRGGPDGVEDEQIS
jgi:hypothetical protein